MPLRHGLKFDFLIADALVVRADPDVQGNPLMSFHVHGDSVPVSIRWVVYHNRLVLEQQKAVQTELDIASVFQVVKPGVFGTASGAESLRPVLEGMFGLSARAIATELTMTFCAQLAPTSARATARPTMCRAEILSRCRHSPGSTARITSTTLRSTS